VIFYFSLWEIASLTYKRSAIAIAFRLSVSLSVCMSVRLYNAKTQKNSTVR